MTTRKVAPHAWKGHAWGDSPFCTKCGRLESHRYHHPQENPMTFRQITTHHASDATEPIEIVAIDTPAGPVYGVRGFFPSFRAALPHVNAADNELMQAGYTVVGFQSGPVPASGANGLTIEAMLAIAADRLQWFQQGPTACAENATVLTNLRASIATLHGRTRRREVEGTAGTAAP